jgi:hypothetical protein
MKGHISYFPARYTVSVFFLSKDLLNGRYSCDHHTSQPPPSQTPVPPKDVTHQWHQDMLLFAKDIISITI